MEIILIIKIALVISGIIGLYAIIRNFDIIKIIFVYFKDKLLGGK